MADWKKLVRASDLSQLLVNHKRQEPLKGTRGELDLKPVVKLFTPWASATFLVTECDEYGMAFGLADVGHPEIGSFLLPELAAIRGPGGLTVERDRHVTFDHPLSWYADQARKAGRITV